MILGPTHTSAGDTSGHHPLSAGDHRRRPSCLIGGEGVSLRFSTVDGGEDGGGASGGVGGWPSSGGCFTRRIGCSRSLSASMFHLSPIIHTMFSTPPFGAPPWLQALRPVQSDVTSFWQGEHVHEHVNNLRETLDLLKAVQSELEQILLIKRSSQNNVEGNDLPIGHISNNSFSPSSNDSILTDVSQCSGDGMALQFSETVEKKKIRGIDQESLSLEAARALFSTLKNQLTPLSVITSKTSSWEEKSVAVRLAQKLKKSRRNKLWKKRKRKQVAELLRKEREDYDKADKEADEWRAREIANDIARRKVARMKEIAKLKANEERKRLESELELVLVVEKLQELRSIRTQKLKKQGHFLPEEDDKFLERVRAAVEEEERQVAAAAVTDAAKDAIATAEESRKAIQHTSTEPNDVNQNNTGVTSNLDQFNVTGSERSSGMDANLEPEEQGCGGGYDSVTNLPFEFYHYYHGSNNDMGTLIEVRRLWDAYIRPGGSRIPGHWIQPPPPTDEVWASYLVGPK